MNWKKYWAGEAQDAASDVQLLRDNYDPEETEGALIAIEIAKLRGVLCLWQRREEEVRELRVEMIRRQLKDGFERAAGPHAGGTARAPAVEEVVPAVEEVEP